MKQLLLTVVAALAAFSANAQTTDAAEFFTNKPFGWATCSTVDGKQFNVNGGYGYGEPKTITLTASGSDDDAAIKNAVTNYDIITLDGSNGDFTVSTQMKLYGIKNKTIVGINNARLCTKFWLTPEIHAALDAAKLESLSSTKQITGTLPNGQTVTMDERAFYTKKTMMEATGDMTMSFAQSGIFAFDGTVENIIIRNLTFQGPGSVDVDGVDLISQYGGNHIWIDHCDFIDGMDGNLDTGKKEGMYVTYSWNIFRYTERSFSHPYSNGCGWLNDAREPQLFITYANCIWREGCARRLPQCGATYLHLLNCLYDCKGNSMGCAVNDYCKALIEGNFSVYGVKDPLSIGSNVIAYELKDNKFVDYDQFNTDKKVGGGVTVPYEYTAVTSADLRNVLRGTHGAGATLDNDKALPVVVANEKQEVSVTQPHKWDFTKRSDETTALLDNSDWIASGTNYTNSDPLNDEPLMADGVELQETKGLLFSSPAEKLVIYNNSIRLNKENSCRITIPAVLKGDKVSVNWKSANSSSSRGFNATNLSMSQFLTDGNKKTVMTEVLADGDVVLTATGGIYVYTIELQRDDIADGIGQITGSREQVAGSYNLQGQKVAEGYRGIVIRNGKKFMVTK